MPINAEAISKTERFEEIALVHIADIEGFSYREIADRVGCPVGTVMSRLCRGRRLLRKRLQDYAVRHGFA
jgi:DNA-directed RNA polymerase specialized sigma24 family protein